MRRGRKVEIKMEEEEEKWNVEERWKGGGKRRMRRGKGGARKREERGEREKGITRKGWRRGRRGKKGKTSVGELAGTWGMWGVRMRVGRGSWGGGGRVLPR